MASRGFSSAQPPLIQSDVKTASAVMNGNSGVFGSLTLTSGTIYPGTATTTGTLNAPVVNAGILVSTSATFNSFSVTSLSVTGPGNLYFNGPVGTGTIIAATTRVTVSNSLATPNNTLVFLTETAPSINMYVSSTTVGGFNVSSSTPGPGTFNYLLIGV